MEVVLLTSRKTGLPVLFLQKALEEHSIKIVAVVYSHNQLDKKKLFRQKLKKVLKHGITTIFAGFYLRKIFHEADFLPSEKQLDRLCSDKKIPFIEIKRTVNLDDEDKAKLSKLTFDIGISIGNSYLGKLVINLPKLTFINIHHELLPAFKGAQSIIWQLYHHSSKTGYTIHKMNREIDGGAILFRKEFQIKFYPSFRETVQKNLVVIKQDSILSLIQLINEKKLDPIPVEESEHTYTTPTLFQLVKMYRNYSSFYQKQSK